MPDLRNSSFIPKQGPAKRRKSTSTRQVYFFTLISYAVLLASFIAAGGVFFYDRYVNAQLDQQVAVLNGEIGIFNEADMQRVLEFDRRLNQAQNRLSNSTSIVSVFEALEDSVTNDIQIDTLSIERKGDETYKLSATIVTDSFDATIFQRGIFQSSNIISSVDIADVNTADLSDGEEFIPRVNFTADLEIPLNDVPFVPGSSGFSNPPPVIPTPAPINTPEPEEAVADVDTADNQAEESEDDISDNNEDI